MKIFFRAHLLNNTLSICFAVLSLGAAAQVGQSITYGTYFGGSGDDGSTDLDLMPDGSIATGGRTGSFNLEVMNPFQQNYGGNSDGYIAIFSPEGALSYSSFLGGTEFDELGAIRALPDGGYVVVGRTHSTDFPITPGAFQSEFSGTRVGFICRFSPDHTLVWSTYYGGPEISHIFGMAIDDNSNIYVHGNTISDDIATPGTHQQVIGPDSSLYPFIVKFSPDGERLWSTYFYGNDSEELYWIDISADGQQLYVAGVTTSTTGIALNAHQDTYHGGQGDGFLCAFNAADGTLNWGTYYGGNEFDRLNGGMVEETGTLYLSGSTSSTSDIATEGTHQAEFAGNRDGFIVAFTPVGERLWGTYSGGNDFDGLGSLSVNNGALTVIGGTRSLTGIATADAMYPENTVNLDAFPPRSGSYLTQFNAIDGTLRWGTYLMPECYRLGISKIMTASDNKLIIGGLVSLASILCPDIITPGAHQSFAEGSGEAVLMFIQDNTLSVNSEDHHTLSIYPNPASHKVIIDLPDANFSRMHLQVIDLSGRVVLDVPAFAMGSAIELDGMAPGLYLVKGAQDGHYFSEKLVVGR